MRLLLMNAEDVEGFNNKIRLLTKQAYGYREFKYFRLKVFDLPNLKARDIDTGQAPMPHQPSSGANPRARFCRTARCGLRPSGIRRIVLRIREVRLAGYEVVRRTTVRRRNCRAEREHRHA